MSGIRSDDAFAEWRHTNRFWLDEAEYYDINWDSYISLLRSAFKAGWNSQKHVDKIDNEIDET